MTTRRDFLAIAAALGVSGAFASARAAPSTVKWREDRSAYPEGVASGDPQAASVILWTRRAPGPGVAAPNLTVEVAEDEGFTRVVAKAPARGSAASDWTSRVMVGGLKPSRVYWYRFTDQTGAGSRIGRTRTSPAASDGRAVNFAFVSCQNVNQGAQNAWRRMIHEDAGKTPADQLDFVLHLGDFIYEIVWYPEDRTKGMYDRRLRDVVRYPSGEKIADYHVPTTVEDYRAVYRGYLADPDIQDARARWPFVNMWDNHEFSWRGYQGVEKFGDSVRPAQTRKVAANQAWFEYQPARVIQPSTASLDVFVPPQGVKDAPIGPLDANGLGQDPSNLAAINSLKGYRSLRLGRHIELFLTDQHSYRSDDPLDNPAADAFGSKDHPYLQDDEMVAIFDAGKAYDGGKPPATIAFGGQQLPNPLADKPPATLLGAAQKAWFKGALKASAATWKIWGNSEGSLDMRTDPGSLPAVAGASPWPGTGLACFGGGDWSGYRHERAEIHDMIRDEKITGFAIVSGDRHSFWAGLASSDLPPKRFEPVGVAFITGSISAPGLTESAKYGLKGHPLRGLYVRDVPGKENPEPTVNMLVMRGARAAWEYAQSGDLAAARALTNPHVSPHLSFLDMGGHGYATVKVTGEEMLTEFVCIPRPLERATGEDGGPVLYRVRHAAKMWSPGQPPRLEQTFVEGEAPLSV